MTISSTTRTAGPFTGNGVAYLFPFAFKVFQVSDLYVASVLIATGVESVLELGPGYTVALNAAQDSNPGGTVILTAGPLAAGNRLIVTSDAGNLQPTEYLNQGGFYPEILTASLDRATILIQQLQEYISLALQFPVTDPPLNSVLPSAEVRAGSLLGFDLAGNPALYTMAGAGAISLPTLAAGTVDGVNRVFTFTAPGTAAPAAFIFAGGIFQSGPPAGDDYALTSLGAGVWQILFTVAPVQGPITVMQFA